MHAGFLACLIVSKKFGYAYLGSPKCGNTQVKALLWQAEHEAGNCPALDDPMTVHVRSIDDDSPWFMSWNCPDLEERLAARSGPLFTTVRDPYERILSTYLGITAAPYDQLYFPKIGKKPGEDLSFAEFLDLIGKQRDSERDVHWMSLRGLLLWDSIRYDKVIRTENIDVEFGSFISEVVPSAKMKDQPPLGAASAERKQAVHKDERTSRLIRQIYAGDFEMLDSIARDTKARVAERSTPLRRQ